MDLAYQTGKYFLVFLLICCALLWGCWPKIRCIVSLAKFLKKSISTFFIQASGYEISPYIGDFSDWGLLCGISYIWMPNTGLSIEVFQLHNLAMGWPARRQHVILVTRYHKNLNDYEEDQKIHKKLLCIWKLKK